MAEAGKIDPNAAGFKLSDFMDFTKLFFPQTSVETSAPSSDSIANSNAVLNAIMPNVQGTAQTDAVVNNILQRAAQAFAPNLAEPHAAGTYNTTVLKQLTDEAKARATGEASKAVLDAQQEAAKTAAGITNAQMLASKTATNVKKPAIPTSSLLPMLGASMAISALKDPEEFVNKITKFPASISKLFGGGPQGQAGASPELTRDFWGDAPENTASNVADVGAGETTASGGLDAASQLTADFYGPVDIGAETGVAAGAAAEAGTEVAAEGATSSLAAGGEVVGAGAESGAELLTAGDFAAAGGETAGVGAVAEVAGESLLEEAAPVAIAAWVICTELKEKGELNAELYATGARHLQKLSATTIRGYHFWAIPYTRWMRRSEIARKFIIPFAVGRTKFLAGRWNLLGFLTVLLGEPACWLIGKCIKENEDWRNLYA